MIDAIEEKVAVALAEARLHSLKNFDEEIGGKKWDDSQDGVGALSGKAACIRMGMIAELIGYLQDPPTGLLRNARMVIEHAGNRPYTNFRFASDIIDRYTQECTPLWKGFQNMKERVYSVKRKKAIVDVCRRGSLLFGRDDSQDSIVVAGRSPS